MDPASASLGVIRSLAGKADDVIRAYHGSPHSFSRFDASKIGTGEGAQAYGHGLYFAGNEEVARGYRNALRWRGWDTTNPAKRAAMWIETRGGRDEALEALQDAIDKSYFGRNSLDATLNQQAIDYLRSGGGTPPPPPGHMYEVQIDYPKEALLNYERPFSTPVGAVGAAVLRQRNPAALTEATLRGIQDGSWRMESYPFNNPYERAGIELARLARTRGGAQALKEAGIPGIRYLDQGSRSAGKGTRNYVMFPGTEDRIKILRQYGLLPPLMAPALMEDE